ncbi:MAG: GNAT family N-acetyltransferase [Candidatus Hodarchaeales archaeon]
MPLEGDKVLLREVREADISLQRELRNDLVTQAWSKTLPPDFPDIAFRKLLEAREFSFDPDRGIFIIEMKETSEAVGYITYSGLERRHSATYGIMLKKDYFGKGIAFDAQECLLRFLFCELGCQVIRLWTHSGNPRMIGLAKKSGFQVAFRQREAVLKEGQLFDNVNMDLLVEEYFERHPELPNPQEQKKTGRRPPNT